MIDGIPTPAMIAMIHNYGDPLDQAYARAYNQVRENHARQVRAGAIGLQRRLFVHAAIQEAADTVYLFQSYRML